MKTKNAKHFLVSAGLSLVLSVGFCLSLKWFLEVLLVSDANKVAILLATREDIFPDYDETHFETALKKYYKIENKMPVEGSKRTIYLWKK